MSPSDPKTEAKRLLDYLRPLKNDRGAMADLRCALSPGKRARAWPLLAPVGGVGNRLIETVAGLFAWHPEETHDGNLGNTCKRLREEHESFDARFRRFLSCGREEIYDRLRPVILAARPRGIPLNYEQLYVDLWYWGDRVKERWAREYWGAPQPEERLMPTQEEAAPMPE